MPDSSISTAVNLQLHNRLGFLFGLQREFDLQIQSLSPVELDRVKAKKVSGDEGDVRITAIEPTRFNPRSGAGLGILDADVDGLTFGRIDDGLGGTNHQIKFFNDQARTTLVAQTPATVNDNATGAFTPQAGFFLAGSITIGPIVADVDFVIAFGSPAYRRTDDEFDGTFDEDENLRQITKLAIDTARTSMASARDSIRSVTAQLVQGAFADIFITGSTSTELIDGGLADQGDGTIIEEPVGRLEDIRDGQQLNTGSAGVISAQEQVEASVVTFPGTFQGTGSAMTLNDRAVAGNSQFVCTKGLDDTEPTFEFQQTPDDRRLRGEPDFIALLPTEFDLTLGKTFKDQDRGIQSFTLDYLAIPANEVGIPINTTPSLWSVTGMTSTNSDAGRLWILFDLATDELRFFNSQTLRDNNDPNGIVATASSPGTASAFVTPAGTTGLVVSGTTGAALNDADKANVDFQPPVAGPVASRFEAAISVTTEPGLLQAGVRKGAVGGSPWRFHSTGAPNLTNGMVTAGLPNQARLFGDTD